jgi:hypothetical protein
MSSLSDEPRSWYLEPLPELRLITRRHQRSGTPDLTSARPVERQRPRLELLELPPVVSLPAVDPVKTEPATTPGLDEDVPHLQRLPQPTSATNIMFMASADVDVTHVADLGLLSHPSGESLDWIAVVSIMGMAAVKGSSHLLDYSPVVSPPVDVLVRSPRGSLLLLPDADRMSRQNWLHNLAADEGVPAISDVSIRSDAQTIMLSYSGWRGLTFAHEIGVPGLAAQLDVGMCSRTLALRPGIDGQEVVVRRTTVPVTAARYAPAESDRDLLAGLVAQVRKTLEDVRWSKQSADLAAVSG